MGDAFRRVRETAVDGVLIGRGAQGNPWLFKHKATVKRAIALGREPYIPETSISLNRRFAVIAEHSEHFEQLCGRSRFMAMRKHLTWYCRDFRGAAEMRGRMTRTSNSEEVRQCLADFLSRTGQNAAVERASLDARESPPAVHCFVA
jgi:tRNA-dihydrouridine synthase